MFFEDSKFLILPIISSKGVRKIMPANQENSDEKTLTITMVIKFMFNNIKMIWEIILT